MFSNRATVAISAAVFGILGLTESASAQAVASPGCNAINAGTFDHAPGAPRFPTILGFDFFAGEVITVTITDAEDSFAFIGTLDFFDFDVGSQSRTETLGIGGFFNAGSFVDGDDAAMNWACGIANVGGGQNEVDEATNEEATGQAIEENVRLPVVPAALGTTFGTGEFLQRLEQQRVEQAIENRILVRQGVEELRKRANDNNAAIAQEESRIRNNLEEVVSETRSAEIDEFGRRVASVLREEGDLSESEIAEIVSELRGGVVIGVSDVFRTLGVEEEKRQNRNALPSSIKLDDDDGEIDPLFYLAEILTGFDAVTTSEDAENVNSGNLLRIGFARVVMQVFEQTVFGKSLPPSTVAAIRSAIDQVEPLEEKFKPDSGGPLIASLTANPLEMTLGRNVIELESVRAAEEAINKGNFERAAEILGRQGVDIGAAGEPNADFDTESKGGADLGLNDGEQILFSSRNGRTLDFAFDSDFLKQIASLSYGGDGAVTGPSDTKIWIKGRVALLDGDSDGADGESAEVLIGAVQRLSNQLEVGAFAGFFTSDLTTNTLATDVETDAFKLGLYGNYLTPNGLRLGLSGAVDFGDTETNRGGVTAQFNYRSYDLSGSVAGAALIDKWVISPSFSGTLSHRRTDKHTDSGGLFIGNRSDTEVIATASVGVSRTFLVDADMVRAISPNVVATGNYFFVGNNDNDDFDHLAVTVGGGASISFQNGANLSMTTGVGGFGQATMSYSGQLRFTLPF